MFLGLIALIMGCDPSEEKITAESNARLTFSTDTVIFDTLFSSVGSITKRLRVFNQNDKAVKIDRLALGKGGSSAYTITINGTESTEFRDEVIFGGDSLLILVKVLIDPMNADLPFLVKDSVVVESNGNFDHVKLVSWGQDAIFVDGEIIDCNTTWTATRPYVIYNFAIVDSLCVLNVDPGTRIFIDNNASLFVEGSLRINGTVDQKVIIRNTRLDPKFNIAPGQWGGIFFLEGTFDNSIEHAIISNGQIGLRIGSPDDDSEYDVRVGNTIIEHMSGAGILAFTSDVYAYNTAIYNCGEFLVGNLAGGNYTYEHCTFTNDPNDFFFRNNPAILLSDNVQLEDNSVLTADLSVTITNSILWGPEREEFGLDGSGGRVMVTNISNNIIRSTDTALEDLGNIISQERNFPGFFDERIHDYQLDSLANARNKGSNIGISHDILGTERDEMPDFGAYERLDSIR